MQVALEAEAKDVLLTTLLASVVCVAELCSQKSNKGMTSNTIGQENYHMKNLIIIVLSLIFIVGCASTPSDEQLAAANIGEAPDIEALKAVGEPLIRSNLKDPSSAIFRWVPASARSSYNVGSKSNIAWVVLVGVNSKNSYGGYGGEQAWMIYVRDNAIVALHIPENRRLNPTWYSEPIPIPKMSDVEHDKLKTK